MIRYVITTHAHLPGARLSRLGSWGNLPHDSVEAAEQAAERDAGTTPHIITRKALPALHGGTGERGAAFDSAPRNRA